MNGTWFDDLPPVPPEITPIDADPDGLSLERERDVPCDGDCIYGYDILSTSDGVRADVLNTVAYPDPACSRHGIGYLDTTDDQEVA